MDGFGEALLGTVLLARLPVQPPEVLFFVPGDDEEDGDANSLEADGPESPVDDIEPESSRDDFSILRSRNMGAPVMSSAEDLNRHSLQYFGVPSTTLAKLMIPMSQEQLCNRLIISEVDAGKFEYVYRHNPKDNHDHLLFVSYPCGFAKIADRTPDQWEQTLPKSQLVQCWNIVHVLDSKLVSRLEARVQVLGEVTQLVQEKLCQQEIERGYVSWEVRRLKELIRAKSTGDPADPAVVESPHPFEGLIRDLYNNMKESSDSQKLQVNGEFVYRIHDCPQDTVEILPVQGISLIRSKKDVESQIHPDTDSSVKILLETAKPWMSLADLCCETMLDISTLQRAAQQLIVMKKAKVVNVFRKKVRVALAQGIDTSGDSAAAKHFAEWRKKHDPERGLLRKKKEAREQKNSKTTFSEVLAVFREGMKIETLQEDFKNEAEFQLCLGYLVAQGLVVQLGHFCHFMPARADQRRKADATASNSQELRATHLWKPPATWDPSLHLKEYEFRVLESRTSDPDVLRFFVDFVLRIARPHKRLDSVEFDNILQGMDETTAMELLEQNSDIFLLYRSRS